MMDNEQAAKIINTCDPGWRVIAVAVPTRALRIIADDFSLKFRVEQLNPGAVGKSVYTWRTVSTHAGDESFESCRPAILDMLSKQARLKEKIKFAQHEARMAQLKAQSPVTS
jgi:hypothetical protein